MSDERAREEIAGSKRDARGAARPRGDSLFCYPGGLYGEREVRLVAEAGFRAACTCEPGLNTELTDPFRLHRIRIEASDSLLDFRAKLEAV